MKPCGDDDQRDRHRRAHGDAEGVAAEDQDQADDERDAAPDVTPGVAHGGDGVHAVGRGDVHQHGVVEHQAQGVPQPRYHEDDQEHQPLVHEPEGGASYDAYRQHAGEHPDLHALPVGDRAKERAHQGHEDGGDGCGVSPVGEVVHGAQVLPRDGVEVDRYDGGQHQRERGVAHVVENPGPLGPGQLEGHVRHSTPNVRSKRAHRMSLRPTR